MKLVVFWFGRWVPAAILMGVGAWALIVDHAPWPVPVGAIVLGCLSVALSVWITRVHKRYRQFVTARQRNA